MNSIAARYQTHQFIYLYSKKLGEGREAEQRNMCLSMPVVFALVSLKLKTRLVRYNKNREYRQNRYKI
jgi:hypothetical protein